MRVITGTARGMALKAPKGMDTRPTMDQVKEGIFSAIQFEVEGRRVLDLFAGSGQMGIEALSRGAKFSVFVDMREDACRVVRENLAKTRLEEASRVVRSDYLSYLKSCRETFDLVFLDPPYGKYILLDAIPLSAKALEKGGVIVCEHDASDKLPESFEGLELFRRKAYGRTVFSFYRKEQENT